MKIGIDIRAAVHEPAGIGTLALNLVRQLGSVGRENEYFLYSDREFDCETSTDNVHLLIKSYGDSHIGKMMWHAHALTDARYRRRLDGFVSFGSLQLPALTRDFVILIIPDLSHVLMPEFHVAKSRFTSRMLMSIALTNARRIVAISEHTKKDILHYMKGKINEADITVAYPACDVLYRQTPSPQEVQQVRKRYGLDRNYILTVGTLEPRKNIPMLIRAFAELVKEDSSYDLVVVGKKGWLYESVFEEVRTLGIDEMVKFLGFVPLHDMPSLYSMADVFVYPSLYEGFGIPPLEAMTCGVPVIASNVASLPEVTGDAAVLVDPHNAGTLRFQLKRLLSNPQLRVHYGRAGKERAQLFSWRTFAEQVLSSVQHQP
jgi:glycosyltransferase involved in cell wall biosynthesis